ncbi:sigma-E factor negative regulatory protein [Ideonella sp. A 288]|uniref:sigma-E factor negative regulatory protein n=1 Tax=Ideonella sp. A 288 TaxID=1962181 RepID=UPI001F3E0EB5|nr:sigma-E factor negative regulatory protein [Ideonella sp. A 288]
MSNRSDEMGTPSRQLMSDLADGRLGPAEVEGAMAAWKADPRARECWHTYQLIGDVLRSDELSSLPARDAAFLDSLRGRLAVEPVPLAPWAPEVAAEPARAPARHRTNWQLASAAAAAGFVAVAGVLVVLRPTSQAPVQPSAATLASTAPPEQVVANGRMIRDAQLDRYLSAHRRVSNGASLAMPGAVVRSVDSLTVDDK